MRDLNVDWGCDRRAYLRYLTAARKSLWTLAIFIAFSSQFQLIGVQMLKQINISWLVVWFRFIMEIKLARISA